MAAPHSTSPGSEVAPPQHRDFGPLERAYRRSLRASVEALFPPNPDGAPDWQQTALEPRMLHYVDHLPPPQRRLLKLMFIGVEYLAIVMSPGLRPFSWRTQQRRERNIRAWRASHILPIRMIGDALKSAVQMVYLSHPALSAYIGEFKSWKHDPDPWQVAISPAPDVRHFFSAATAAGGVSGDEGQP